MGLKALLDARYRISEDVVAREIQGEFIIIPVMAGIGDLEDIIYTLNETGKAVWEKLNGARTIEEVAAMLAAEYEGPLETIQEDVVGVVSELLKRRIVIEIEHS